MEVDKMSKCLIEFERYYESARHSREIDELGLIAALHKSRLPSGYVLKAIWEKERGQECKRFLNKDEFIGFIFDQCAIGNQYVFSLYHEKSAHLISVYMAIRERM